MTTAAISSLDPSQQAQTSFPHTARADRRHRHLEAEVLFEALADRVTRVDLAGKPKRLNDTLRCLAHLPVPVAPA